MLRREGWVKRFGAQSGIQFRKTQRSHQGEGAEPADVAVGESASVVQSERDGYVAERFGRKGAVVDEERAGEARLDHDSVAGVEGDHDGLGAAVAALDARSQHASRQ